MSEDNQNDTNTKVATGIKVFGVVLAVVCALGLGFSLTPWGDALFHASEQTKPGVSAPDAGPTDAGLGDR